jgi:hypothetical protein
MLSEELVSRECEEYREEEIERNTERELERVELSREDFLLLLVLLFVLFLSLINTNQ